MKMHEVVVLSRVIRTIQSQSFTLPAAVTVFALVTILVTFWRRRGMGLWIALQAFSCSVSDFHSWTLAWYPKAGAARCSP